MQPPTDAPEEPASADILIVGGGYSGSLLAVQLLRQAAAAGQRPPRLLLLERTAALGRGLAYGSADVQPLLNAPVGNMSALAGQPDDFLHYASARLPGCEAGSFVPRALYGDYLQHTLATAAAATPGRLQSVQTEALNLQPAAAGPPAWVLQGADGRRWRAPCVVLALGHADVADPLPAPGLAALGWRHAPAWDLAALDRLAARVPPASPIAVLGTGHSAVDAALRLCAADPARRVWLFSRRGLLPQAHRAHSRPPAPPQGEGLPWLAGVPLRMHRLLHALRQAARQRQQAGGDWRDLMNELRPRLPALWQALPPAQRARFLRHALPWWDAHRHRLAPQAAERLHTLQQAGRLRVQAGRVLGVELQPEGVLLRWRPRQASAPQDGVFGAVVNATGPQSDLARSPMPLVQTLHAAGWLQPDALRLGLALDAHYRPLDGAGQPVPGLHYIGPGLRARDWEAVAVPELREHAARLAAQLLRTQGAGRVDGS